MPRWVQIFEPDQEDRLIEVVPFELVFIHAGE